MNESKTYASLAAVLISLAAILVALRWEQEPPVVEVPAPEMPVVAHARPIAAEAEIERWSVFFSPNGGAQDALVHQLKNAKKTILVQAYSFTAEEIGDALIEARERGVDVQVIVDKGQAHDPRSLVKRCDKAKIPVYVDSAHAIAHAKIMIVDGHTVMTGSYNFSEGAEHHNSECFYVVPSKQFAEIHERNWQKHKEHSTRWKP